MVRLVPLIDRAGLEGIDVATLLPVLPWACLEHGQPQRAVGVLGQVFTRAKGGHAPGAAGRATRACLDCPEQGQREETARNLEEGLAQPRDLPYPYAEARLLQVVGQLESCGCAASSAGSSWRSTTPIAQPLGGALTQQAALCVAEDRRTSGGISVTQRSTARGQRGLNGQPRGGCSISGGLPGIGES